MISANFVVLVVRALGRKAFRLDKQGLGHRSEGEVALREWRISLRTFPNRKRHQPYHVGVYHFYLLYLFHAFIYINLLQF